jgi:membrane fusion protein, multidrug efflux system
MKTGLPATASWGDKVLNGKVVQVDMAINQAMQSFGAMLEFENTGGCLQCGVTADISVKTYQNPKAFSTEIKNVLTGQEGTYVYLIDNGLAKKQQVKEGFRQNLTVEIVDGLKSGDQLVTEGQMLLEPGSKVKIVE